MPQQRAQASLSRERFRRLFERIFVRVRSPRRAAGKEGVDRIPGRRLGSVGSGECPIVGAQGRDRVLPARVATGRAVLVHDSISYLTPKNRGEVDSCRTPKAHPRFFVAPGSRSGGLYTER